MTNRRVEVFGPAYLDRVLRVDRPLTDPAPALPSIRASTASGSSRAQRRSSWSIPRDPRSTSSARDWPGPTGKIRLSASVREGAARPAGVRGMAWHDDLGGMGAGYAAALGGRSARARGRSPTRRARPSRRGWPSSASHTPRFACPIVRRTGRC